MGKLTFFTIALSLGLMSVINLAKAQTANIYIGNTDQTITGFGGMNFPRWIADLSSDQVDKAFGNNNGQIGLSILRISVSPNSSQWNMELPTAQRAKEHGAIVFATPWSPPASMKTNGSTTQGELRTDQYGAYANYLRDFTNYMSSNGASLYAISVQNEPDFLPDYESCGWSGQQIRTFLDNNASVIPTSVIAPETVHYKADYMDAIASSSQLDILANHNYGGSPTRYNSSKQQWMTEHITDTEDANNMTLALNLGKEIHDFMTAGYNAYVWWYIRRSYGLITEDGNVSKRGFVMGHFSKFVRPGYVRVRADAAPASGVSVSAYQSGSTLVVVAVNQSSSSSNITFNFSGNNVSNFNKWETTGTTGNNVADKGIVGSGTSVTNTLAGYSMNTFRGTVGGSSGSSSYYNIQNRHSSKCLRVENSSSANEAYIIQEPCNTSYYSMQYELLDAGDSYLYIKNRATTKCLRALNGYLVQYDCNTGWYSEMFSRQDVGSGYYLLQNRNTGTCLRVENSSTADGARFVLESCNTGWYSQHFSFPGPRSAASKDGLQMTESDFSIYPNPSYNGNFSIHINGNDNEGHQMSIFSQEGKKVFETANLNTGKNEISTGLKEGLYFIQIDGNNTNNKIQKLVIQ